ncbi:MAG TPA: sulfotransferase [Herpetosiphonaceae bacterium]
MALKVIGAGFGRTGTSSLKQSLEDLDFGPCYHMTEAFAHPEHAPVWEAAANGQPVEWEDVFRDYQAAVDWPAAAFYQQLMVRYPEAKVILTVRDPERWYESTQNTIYEIGKLTSSPPMSWLLAVFNRQRQRIAAVTARLAWAELFSGRFEDRQHAIDVFNRYNADVERHVPADRLLVYDVKQGWEPLCAFLGVPVPEGKPFPHLNDTAEFRKAIRAIQTVSYGLQIGTVALAVLAMLGLIRRTRSR